MGSDTGPGNVRKDGLAARSRPPTSRGCQRVWPFGNKRPCPRRGLRPAVGCFSGKQRYSGTSLPAGDLKPIPLSLPEPVSDSSKYGEGLAERTTRLLPLSGKSTGALRELAKRYHSWLEGQEASASDATLSDLAWTAGVGRSHFPHRAGLVFHDAEQLREGLRALTNAEASDGAILHEATKVAFAYTGQESLRVGIGEALYRSEPVARAVLDRCDELIRQERRNSLLDVMFGRPGVEQDPDDPAWVQPAIYALECALTAQWASVGVRPSVVSGSRSGSARGGAGGRSIRSGRRIATCGGSGRTEEDAAGAGRAS